MQLILSDAGERGTRIYNRPVSAIQINDKKINYYDYISGMENDDLNNALLKIVPCIKEEEIKALVDITTNIIRFAEKFLQNNVTREKTYYS